MRATNKSNRAGKPETHAEPTDRLATMQEAMAYLNSRGIPCKSRDTFYRILRDFDVPYANMNPNGKNEIRRFNWDDLKKIAEPNGTAETNGLEP